MSFNCIRTYFYTAVGLVIVAVFFAGCTTPSILVTREQQSGDMLFNQYNYPEAVTHYQKMLDASKNLGVYRNLSMEADVLRKIANCYVMMGRYDNAENNIDLALINDSIENNTLSIIKDHRMIGKIRLYSGNNFGAIKSFERSLALSEGMDQSLKNTNKNSIAENQLALGQLYATMGRFDKSLELTGKSLALFKETANRDGEMETLLLMASVYYNLGDLEMSKELTGRSMAIAEELKLGLSRHLNNLARISATLGEYQDAIRMEELALAEAYKNNIAAQRIWFTIRLGDLYKDLGDSERSVEYYKRARLLRDTLNLESENVSASIMLREGDLLSARTYFISQGSDVGAGISYLRLAEIALENMDLDEAINNLENAGYLFQNTKNRLGIASISLHTGIYHSLRKEYEDAIHYFDIVAGYNEFPELHWQSLYRKGLIFEEMGKLTDARDSYLESVDIIEKIRGNLSIEEFKNSFINNKVDVYDRLIGVYLKLNKPTLALDYTERAKARSFYEMLANRKINYTSDNADSLIQDEQAKRFEIQQLYKQLQSTENSSIYQNDTREINRQALTRELEAMQEEYDNILIKLKLFNPEYSDIVSFSPVSYEEVRASLKEKTTILSYWISDQEIQIWHISGKEITHKSVAVARTELTGLISDARTHIATNATSQANSDLEKLYKLLIEPVEEGLKDVSSLVIIPNKSLHFLPFQALRKESGDYLVSSYNITYEPSLSVYHLKHKTTPIAEPGFFGVALGDISIGLNIGLPGTEDELNKIIPLFENTRSSFGKNSTETFVKENIGKYNYIHLATHGIFNFEQPAYSFLLFPPSEKDDGRLTVNEVMELNLESRLVTLSACETGLGYLNRGDEMIGLSRSFLFAGSSAVIVSLWSVADYQTSLLMSKFYTYIKDHSLEESLALAQREVMGQFPNPFYWSPFILIGNGN